VSSSDVVQSSSDECEADQMQSGAAQSYGILEKHKENQCFCSPNIEKPKQNQCF